MHSANHRRFLDYRQHFILADIHGDRIGVAVSHKPASGTMPGHPKPARVVDDEQVRATTLDELGADASAGARGDNGLPFAQRGMQSFDDFFAAIGVSFSSQWIWHMAVTLAGSLTNRNDPPFGTLKSRFDSM